MTSSTPPTIPSITALVNTTRVLATLATLRSFGATHGGIHGRGVSRPSLSPADVAARRWLASEFADAGLRAVRIDGLGTVFGEGGSENAPALLMGSHSDSQPEGGWLDGALGVAYALEASRVLHEASAPGAWAAISFADEEGRWSTLTGSRSFAGLAAPPLSNPELAAARADAGLADAPLLHHSDARAGPWLGFLEAHIEQGPRLERANASLGVVTAIVGMRQLRLLLRGEQNHAGGCPMDERADAGLAAMRLAAGLDAAIRSKLTDEDAAVWTFPLFDGFVSHSTVPGATNLTLQFRAPTEAPLDTIEALARAHCEGDRASLGLQPLSSARPVMCTVEPARAPIAVTPMDSELVSCVAAAARAAAASPAAVLTMPSRAIHDAAPVAKVMPTAMLFVPSIGGISHSFDEHTHDEDIAVGAVAYVGAAAGIVLGQCAAG